MIRAILLCMPLMLILTSPCPAAQSTAASAVIESLNSALLETMQHAAELGYRGRFEKLAEVIESTHDLEYIAQFSIGRRNWEGLDETRQKRFVEAFRNYSIATYANRFNGYSGETFRVTGEEVAKRGQVQVTSLLEIPGEESVDFLYLLKPAQGTLKIVNIIVQGVSDLALKRAEFMSLLNEKGFDALLAHLEEKTAEYAEEQSK
ncbi:MAG: ABC transporter substrate-binding protein [Gammaproteobacteria bacterium]